MTRSEMTIPRHTPLAPPLRSDLASVPRYVAGRPPLRGSGYKLSSNEVADPPLRRVAEAAGRQIETVNRYPDIAATTLVDRLSAHLGAARDRVLVGGGSIALLQDLLLTATDPGDAVVFAWRSYEAYPIVSRVCRTTPVLVPLLPDHRHDLGRMAEAVRAHDARAVIVCSPNNPTGTIVDRAELEQFLDAVPQSCLVILDEAYREFATNVEPLDAVALSEGRSNVVVLRTFSKAHGLAGLRVGYAVAPAAVADAVRAVALPFTVSSVAQAAAVAALEAWPQQQPRVAEITRRRDEFAARLTAQGFEVADSHANFVWLPSQTGLPKLLDALSDNGISVRQFGEDGVRITVGEPEAIDIVVHAASETGSR